MARLAPDPDAGSPTRPAGGGNGAEAGPAGTKKASAAHSAAISNSFPEFSSYGLGLATDVA